jgi:hypothetical protein
MSDRVVCRSCGTMVEVGPDGVGQRPITLEAEKKPHDIDLHRLLLVVCYVLAVAGVAAFFILGMGFSAKSAFFFWPINEAGQSFMRFVDDNCLPAIFFPLMLLVAGAFVAVPLRSLVFGILIGGVALGAYLGFFQFKKDLDWANIGWFYGGLAAALLAILVGLLLARRWIVLAWFVPASIGLAFLSRYLNRDGNHTIAIEFAPFFAGVLHGLIIGVAARLAGWIINRDAPGVVLGAFIGGFLGLLVADDVRVRELLRSPELQGVQLPMVSLYCEAGLALILAVVLGFLGKRAVGGRSRA